MTVKLIIPRALAVQDVDEAINYYLSKEAKQAAFSLIDELELAYKHISQYPGIGSTRYAHELDLPGLRSWTLKRYPHIVFYIERNDHMMSGVFCTAAKTSQLGCSTKTESLINKCNFYPGAKSAEASLPCLPH